MVAGLEAPALAQPVLVAELFAVVGREHDHGVVPHAEGGEGIHDAAELGVDIGHHAEVLGPEPAG